MARFVGLAYGVVAYLLFLASFLYAIGFVANLRVVPKGIDDGVEQPVAGAVLIDVLLLGLFAVQHNVMARPWFKAWWTRLVPPPLERSTFVALASLLLLLLYWQWRPLPGVVWEIDHGLLRGLVWLLYGAGWGVVLWSSFAIDHFELFGLKQAYLQFVGREPVAPPFSERSLYRWVRHPLMVGFVIAFWAAPTMSWGRLLFATVTTVWICIAVHIEERDLQRQLGEPYRQYRSRTPMLLPWPRRRR